MCEENTGAILSLSSSRSYCDDDDDHVVTFLSRSVQYSTDPTVRTETTGLTILCVVFEFSDLSVGQATGVGWFHVGEKQTLALRKGH